MNTLSKFYLTNLLLLAQFFIGCLNSRAQNAITDYKVSFGTAKYHEKSWIVFRQFKKNDLSYYLTVDPQNMTTQILASGELTSLQPCSFQELSAKLNKTPYVKALMQAQIQALPLQDAGITHAFPKEKGITLTIDLCPSHKGLDRDIFTSLIGAFNNTERPIPIALSITGRFLLKHKEDIIWLKDLVSSGQISITWVNHTYNHRYDPSRPLNQNFLLEPGTNLSYEILALEHTLMEQGFLPSVFFRFPGLISNQRLVDQVISYGLIPIGSDAWLAKGQQAKPGSLVLIHGNGNEPIGVQDFIKLLGSEQTAVHQKQWLLYDLRSAVASEF